MKPELARKRIHEVISRAGKRIDGDTTTAIVERTGFSVRALDSELEKIILYLGDRTEVRRADVLAVLSNTREASIFDLTNAIEERDAGGTIRALRSLAAQREAAQPVLGMIARTVRTLIVARCALEERLEGTFDAGMSYGTFQARILPRLASESGPADEAAAQFRSMHAFRAFTLVKAASRFTLPELLDGLRAIHEADVALKTTGQQEGLILEGLALALCRSASETS
jgi:DNA polymerase-3 subunit delta